MYNPLRFNTDNKKKNTINPHHFHTASVRTLPFLLYIRMRTLIIICSSFSFRVLIRCITFTATTITMPNGRNAHIYIYIIFKRLMGRFTFIVAITHPPAALEYVFIFYIRSTAPPHARAHTTPPPWGDLLNTLTNQIIATTKRIISNYLHELQHSNAFVFIIGEKTALYDG